MATEFMSYEEALEELQVDEEELKKMVSDEELRAFRDGGQLKFKSEEVIRVKELREEQPTIIMPATEALAASGPSESEESPTVVEIEGQDDLDEPTGDVTVEAIGGEELIPTMQMDSLQGGDIALKDDEEEIIAAPLDETEGIDLAEEPATVTEEIGAESATAFGEEPVGIAIADEEGVEGEPGGEFEEELAPAATIPMAAVDVPVPVHPAFTVLLIFGALVLTFAGLILVDIVREPVEVPPYLRGICNAILGK